MQTKTERGKEKHQNKSTAEAPNMIIVFVGTGRTNVIRVHGILEWIDCVGVTQMQLTLV